jgi:lipopolysaccharide transport system ATP-binding protein
MSTVIRVENLGKKYLIKHQEKERYLALRDIITDKIKNFRKKEDSPANEEFWALKDISFEIKQGERLGIIGRNGAGKSTLLKLLSRITEPSTGKISIKGRVASLLEVGTGFHPELSGRENIYLNGSILGMMRQEIKKKFDEIVDFAEVEKFLDTPVKRYSSGMYVRLAFAVAAYLEPEILIVDEVLAVGDVHFQKKCLGKMKDVGNNGRTVIFVSHNMGAIRQLCDRAILLTEGSKILDENINNVINKYISDYSEFEDKFNIKKVIDALPIDPAFKLNSVRLIQNGIEIKQIVENGKDLEIKIAYTVYLKTTGLRVFIDLMDEEGMPILRSFHDGDSVNIPITTTGNYTATVVIPADTLGSTRYQIKIQAGIFGVRYCIPTDNGVVIPISVENTSKHNRAYLGDVFYGKLAIRFNWENYKEREL